LNDYNKAILLDPKVASFYMNRGLLKAQYFYDKAGAFRDLEMAKTLYLEAGKMNDYKNAIEKKVIINNFFVSRGI
jgi:hypothetical protein